MQEIFIENLGIVLKYKDTLESELNVKISNKGKNVFVDGKAEDEYLALKVLEAINIDFSVEHALELKNEDYELHVVNIKDVTKRHDLETIRARIIGTHGKALKTLNDLTQCYFSLSGNRIGIIGSGVYIQDAIQAVTSIILGSKHGNVYSRAEKQRKRRRLEDKGLDPHDSGKDADEK